MVGFGSLPNQLCKKRMNDGVDFNILVVGESGLGKSTLMNSMFLANIYSSESEEAVDLNITERIESHRIDLEENGVLLRLTVIDTPGFGDAINNTGCWDLIVEYIERQFEEFLQNETAVIREKSLDTRVHVCLYFISSSSHGLKPLDIRCLCSLHKKVNVVLVISKADTLTRKEMRVLKEKVRSSRFST